MGNARTSDSGVPARATYRVDATVAGDRHDRTFVPVSKFLNIMRSL
jgi:hypothetical protein